MKPTPARPDLLLVLARTARHGTAELFRTVCYRYDPTLATGWDKHKPGTVLSPLFTDPGGRYDQYADLHVRASVDVNNVNNGRSYAWAYEFRPITVNLPRAQSMAAFLRRTDRQMAALAQQLGSPTDFADYLARFALALGITVFAEHCAELRPDGTHWKWMDVNQMRAWVHHHERPAAAPTGRP
jgi:hypothetical protein